MISTQEWLGLLCLMSTCGYGSKYIYYLHSEQHFSFFHRLHLGEEAWKLRNARTDPADIPQFSHVTSTSNSLRGDNTAIGYTAINDNHVEGVL